MKLFFNLLLFFILSENANAYFITIHSAQQSEATSNIKNYLVEKYEIPDELVMISNSKCPVKIDRSLVICVDTDGSLTTPGSIIKQRPIVSALIKFSQPQGDI